MFANYLKEIFVDSDTKVALLSGAPVDDPFNLFLTNDQIAAARAAVNGVAGSRRMLAHSIIQPMTPGYLDEVDRAIETLKPDSWKGYTIGDPMFLTKKGRTGGSTTRSSSIRSTKGSSSPGSTPSASTRA